MTAYPPPTLMAYIHCNGTLKSGRKCPKLLAIVPSIEQVKGVQVTCPACKKLHTDLSVLYASP